MSLESASMRSTDHRDDDSDNSTKMLHMIKNIPSSLMQRILDQQNDADASTRSNYLTNDTTDSVILIQSERNLLNERRGKKF